jgi:hypothetical protein
MTDSTAVIVIHELLKATALRWNPERAVSEMPVRELLE